VETEATTAYEVTEIAVPAGSEVGTEAEGFGTRPRSDRPHSMSLFGPDRTPGRVGAARGLDLLVGVGIGAAMMYYLDPDQGPRRRAAARATIVALFGREPAD
jgi:hypothetical protein